MILRAKHLINTLADNVGQAQTKTYCDPLCNVNIEAIIDTLGFVEASILVKSWADTAVKVETMTVGYTLGQFQAEAVNDAPSDSLA